MFKIFTHNKTIQDSKDIQNIFSSTPLEIQDIRIVDLAFEDIDYKPGDSWIALGKNAIGLLTAYLLANEGIKPETWRGGKIVDKKNTFLYLGISTDIKGFFLLPENEKIAVWNEILEVTTLYKEWRPFNDEIPFGAEENLFGGDKEIFAEEITETKTPIVEEVIEKITEPTPAVVVEEVATVETVTSVDVSNDNADEVTLDAIDIINRVAQQINLADPTLGKSLTKYEKFSGMQW